VLWFVPRLNSIAFINTIKWRTISKRDAVCFEVRTEFITLQSTVSAICVICSNVNNCAVSPHSLPMCFICFLKMHTLYFHKEHQKNRLYNGHRVEEFRL